MRRTIAPVTCGAAKEVPLQVAHELGLKVSGPSGSFDGDSLPTT